jgi:sugar phosphate isomerase/epimerase
MNQPLAVLETLRRRLETVRHQIGSMSDYLDRGRPSPDEARKTRATMAEQEAVAAELEAQLVAMVQAHRQNKPHLIEQWVSIHQAIFQELNAYFEAHQAEDAYAYRLERYVTAQAIEEWDKVLSGELDFVINNGYVMSKQQDVVRNHFEF